MVDYPSITIAPHRHLEIARCRQPILPAAAAGIVGALLTGPFAAASLGGYGHVDSAWHQLWIQAKGVGFTIAWSAVLSFAILKLLDRVIGLRVDAEQEQMGLDLAEHEERAYNLS